MLAVLHRITSKGTHFSVQQRGPAAAICCHNCNGARTVRAEAQCASARVQLNDMHGVLVRTL